MGNVFLEKPITQKVMHHGENQHLKYWECEMQGWRKYMQDSYIAEMNIKIKDYEDIALFGVFDGHGGAEAAKYIAKHFLQCFLKRKIVSEGKISQALKQTFIQVQLQMQSKSAIQELIQYKSQCMKQTVAVQQLQSGATAVVVAITKDKIICANAGDSRASLWDGKKAVALSYDHKPENPIQRERIQKAGVKIIDGRINGLNLTRSIGDFSHKKVLGLSFNNQPVICIPDIIEIQRTGEQQFIFLACDGVWERYSIDHIQLTELIYSQLKIKNPQKFLEDFFTENICKSLADPNGKDNMTAIIVQFNK